MTKYGDASTIDLFGLVARTLGREGHLTVLGDYGRACCRLDKIAPQPVTAHKKLFGRQDQTWVGGSENRRFFIWRFGGLWVLVHNVKGVCLEVDAQTSGAEALRLWQSYMRKLGLESEMDKESRSKIMLQHYAAWASAAGMFDLAEAFRTGRSVPVPKLETRVIAGRVYALAPWTMYTPLMGRSGILLDLLEWLCASPLTLADFEHYPEPSEDVLGDGTCALGPLQ